MTETLLDFDLRILLFFQDMGTWLYPPMVFISAIGNGVSAIAVSALLVWGGRRGDGLRAGLVSSIAGALNGLIKLGIRQPRPFWIDPRVQGLQFESEFGMPSSHAMWSFTFWTYLVYVFKRLRYLLLAVVMILLVGISRVYLGVHSPTQVIGGWAGGAIVLVLFLLLERPVAGLATRMSAVRQLAALAGISTVLIGSGILVIAMNPEFKIPDLWIENVRVFSDRTLAPVAMDSIVMSTGIFFGMASGAVLWRGKKTGNGEIAGRNMPILRIILKRYAVGIAGFIPLAGLYVASILFTKTIPWLNEASQFVLFSLTGMWITLGAPLAFGRFGLSLPEDDGEKPAV